MAKAKPKKADLNEREDFAAAQGVVSGLVQTARKAIINNEDMHTRLKKLQTEYRDLLAGDEIETVESFLTSNRKDRKSLLALEHECSEMIETMQKPQ